MALNHFLAYIWSAFHLYGKTGENFPPNGTVQPFKLLFIGVEKLVAIFREMEQYKFLLVWEQQTAHFREGALF